MGPDGPNANEPGTGSRGVFARVVKRAYKALVRAVLFTGRVIGAIWLVLLIGPPIVVLLLLGLGAAFSPPSIPESERTTTLLTFLAASIAFSGVCLSYARAAKEESSYSAGIQSGRLFLGASVLLAVSLGTSFFMGTPPVESSRLRTLFIWMAQQSDWLGLTFAPGLAVVAVLRLYFHLLRMAAEQATEPDAKAEPLTPQVDNPTGSPGI